MSNLESIKLRAIIILIKYLQMPKNQNDVLRRQLLPRLSSVRLHGLREHSVYRRWIEITTTASLLYYYEAGLLQASFSRIPHLKLIRHVKCC